MPHSRKFAPRLRSHGPRLATSAALLGLAALAAPAGASPAPPLAVFSGKGVSLPNLIFPFLSEFFGTGTATTAPLGLSTDSIDIGLYVTSDFPSSPGGYLDSNIHGSDVLSADPADTLSVALLLQSVAGPYAGFTGSGAVIGGTGIFAGATGQFSSVTLTSTLDPASPPGFEFPGLLYTATYVGNVTAPSVPESSPFALLTLGLLPVGLLARRRAARRAA